MPNASSVCRVIKNSNYTTMSNFHLRSKNLSLKAIGLLSKVFSLPDDWDYSISGLVAICKENETAVKSALNELKEWGYLIVTKTKCSETGRFIYNYDFYEYSEKDIVSQQKTIKNKIEISDESKSLSVTPDTGYPDIESPVVENLPLENLYIDNPMMESPAVDYHGQLNTNKLNTNKLNTNNKTKRTKELRINADKKKKFSESVNLTEMEYQKLCNDNGTEFTNKCIEVLNNYKLSKGKKYKSDYHAILSWVVGRVNQQYPKLSAKKQHGSLYEDDYSNPFVDII